MAERLHSTLVWAERTNLDMLPRTPEQQATLAQWFVHLPGQAVWSDYLINVVHLRPIDGAPPAVLDRADATHEVLVVALDPIENPRPNAMETWRFLRPINVQCQFQVPSDDLAIEMGRLLTQACLDGVLFIEPGGIRGAREYWQGTVDRTAEHMRTGGHQEDQHAD